MMSLNRTDKKSNLDCCKQMPILQAFPIQIFKIIDVVVRTIFNFKIEQRQSPQYR